MSLSISRPPTSLTYILGAVIGYSAYVGSNTEPLDYAVFVFGFIVFLVGDLVLDS